MKRWNRKALLLAATGLVLAGGASVGSAYAYFTTYTEASGGVKLELGSTKTEIEEKVENGTKIVSVKNTGDYACYVRATAFAGSSYTLTYADGGSGKWSSGSDGYWYYSDLVQPSETTEALHIRIPQDLLSKVEKDGVDQNVIVVQECAAESYDDSGALLPNGPARFEKTTGQ